MQTEVTTVAAGFPPIVLTLTIESAAELREVAEQLGKTTGSTLYEAYKGLNAVAQQRGVDL